MMKKKVSASGVSVCAIMVVVVTLVMMSVSHVVDAANCSPWELKPCMWAITTSTPPSTTCCQNLKDQRPCFCGYLRDPRMKDYVDPARASEVATSCGVPIPVCY
ncbi:hypothetical protein TanjilG_03822 [Lupinus angustifolius]|uniref:Bifunctional inhibitor/plant lipid transfer protein/seed storage helical domain-containing protein n=1 Tax=Lupinus angustifolius TaxID=3871 RepID=A0A394DE82_LUPAN|nr:hypothetical protein TanjilG_03822 [Lupinus angustifolius]